MRIFRSATKKYKQNVKSYPKRKKKHLVKDPKNVKRKLHKLIVIVILAVRPFAGWLCPTVHMYICLFDRAQRNTDSA